MRDEMDLAANAGQPKIATLIEVGTRTINVAYLIVSRQVGEPNPRCEVDVTLASGDTFRLEGDEAELFLSAIAEFVPRRAGQGVGAATPTRVLVNPRVNPGPTER